MSSLEKFFKLLRELDLSTTQIKIYSSVLKNGLSSVYSISKDIKVNRSQIYLDTNILVDIGLLELASKKVRKFLAIDPKKISSIIKYKQDKLSELEDILGEASVSFSKRKKDSLDEYELTIFEGRNKVRDVFDFELDSASGREVCSIVGDIDYQYEFFSEEYWNKWNKKFTKGGGKVRMLVNEDDKAYDTLKENNLKHNIETRGVEDFRLKTNIDIWTDHTLIVVISKNPRAVLIKNKIVADSYKQIFEKLWKQSK
jgi:sugar-specific transcriptional regulator TrmB